MTAVALTNESFVNSGINYQIELVYAGETGYTESGSYGTDLSRFTNAGDGYMDEVHTLRNKYSADICVLLAFFRGACGVATGIGVSVNNAFCLVSTRGSCAIGNYSFGHEIGHLLGCRHDMSFDSSTYPYAYAHGYVYKASTLQNSWRTIMAYPQDCQFGTDAFGNAIYCIRMRYWSNPSVFYDGIPMGTTTLHNNARIWNEQSDRVMTFRQPDNSITVTGSDIPNTRYADFIAKQYITTSGTVNGGSGNELYMRAGNSITLQSGFSVGLGSKFSAAIEDIYDCGSSSSSAPVIDIQDISEDNGDITNTPDFTYTVYPNPTDEFINITYSLDKITSLSIELLNLFGQKIRTVLPKQNRQAGSYLLQIPVSDFPVGTYFLTLSSETISKQDKIIINK